MKDKKKPYEAPQLTVVSFKVEQGFAGSGMEFAVGSWIWDDGESVDGVQDYTMENHWSW